MPGQCSFWCRACKHLTVSGWVIWFNGLSGDSGQRGPYSPYKLCNHSLYIGIIIFPHIDNTIYRPQLTSTKKILTRASRRKQIRPRPSAFELNQYGQDCTPEMKNSSSERKTKTHKIARNWNFIKYKSIQISTNAFLNSSDVEVDEMGWITVISHSLLYMESHIRGITQSCTSPSQPPQPCCPSGWAGGSAGWDYVTVFAELSSCC